MIKVLHITTDFVPGTGGLERFVLDLATQLRPAGVESSVLALNKIAGSDKALPPQDVVAGIPVRRVRFLDLRYYKPTWLPVQQMQEADVLHVHGIGALLDFVVAARAVHRKPIVVSTHGGIFHTSKLPLLKNAYFATVRTLVLPWVDQVVACGGADRQLFAEYGVHNTITIDNGIDLQAFARPATSPKRIENRLLFVGRISPNKCIDHLIRTVSEVRKIGLPATLRIIGPDRYQLNDPLRRLAADLQISDAVTVAGEIAEADLPSEYQAADLFVSASRHEGFGISAVEAMASGAVPVLNDIPAFKYLLKNNDGTSAGAVCDFAEYVGSAKLLSAVLGSDRSVLRQAARSRASDFSWDRLIPKWRSVYESLLP